MLNSSPPRKALAGLALFLAAFSGCWGESEETGVPSREPALLLGDLTASPFDETDVVIGQTIYVPAYSQVIRDSERRSRTPLTISLCIRNTDPDSPITLTSVRYYSTRGDLVHDYGDRGPVRLGPLMSATQTVARRDLRAGEGAKFLVEWVSNKRVSAPIVESVMIGSGTQGISFKSRGEVIRQR